MFLMSPTNYQKIKLQKYLLPVIFLTKNLMFSSEKSKNRKQTVSQLSLKTDKIQSYRSI